MRVLVTGASGFVGRCLVAELRRRSITTRVVCRPNTESISWSNDLEVGALSGPGYLATDWVNVVSDCDVIIHLAARAHVLREVIEDPAKEFHLANVDFARACAAAAATAGVERFILMSSAGVHGGASGTQPFHAGSAIAPHTPYADSKANAERTLAKVVNGTGMALTVIRPPLVYGPEAPGNFGALMRAIARGWPLPLGGVTSNRRSFVALDNLVDLIVTCLNHPAAGNQTFLVSDGEDLSTVDLLHRLAAAMGKPAHLFPVPVGWLALAARLLGKQVIFQSLCESLQVDISNTREILDWKPPVSVDEGLRRAIGRTP